MELFSGIRRVLRLGAWRRELDDELAFHHEETVRELVASGLGEREAREEAARRFGDARRWRRELERLDRWADARARWGARAEAAGSSVALAVRRIRRSPGFAAGVVLTFALGIGANAMMFSIIDRLLLSPPAHVVEPERVRRMLVEATDPGTGERRFDEALSYHDFQDLKRAGSIASVAAVLSPELIVGSGAAAEKRSAEVVSGEYFSLLGVRPGVGRFFGPAEEAQEGAAVAVISHALWLGAYGGAADVVGRTIDLGHGPYEIVGVAPEGFTGINPRRVDLWIPLRTYAARTSPYCLESRSCSWLRLVARLAPDASLERAEAEGLALLVQGWALDGASARDRNPRLVAAPLLFSRGPQAGQETRVALWVGGVALFVLLIACANIANLLLARATRQQREVGVRLALGSSGIRVVGPIVAESLLLAAAGGALALAIAVLGAPILGNLLLPGLLWEDAGTGRAVLGVVAGLVLFAGLVSGLIPALQTARAPIDSLFRTGSRASAPASRSRDALIVLQTALSVLLLVGAGLFVRSLREVRALDLGLQPDGVYHLLPEFEAGIPTAERISVEDAARERLATVPGVSAVATDGSIPFWSSATFTLRVPGLDSIPLRFGGPPVHHSVTAGYFDLLDLSVLRGRAFLPEDRGGELVAVVNETMARRLWPTQDAIGKCLIVGDDPNDPEVPPCARVVGVVENARRFGLIEGEGMQYYLFEDQYPEGQHGYLLVRIEGEAGPVLDAIRRELYALDTRIRYVEARAMSDAVDSQTRSWMLGASMLSAFGILALVVAACGLYSVLAFGVAQRTLELGIRSALGATGAALVRLVVARSVGLVGVGVAAGLVAAVLVGPRLEPLLFQVSPYDRVVFLGVATLLVGTALLAAGLPARRATRVDPAVALRAE